MNAKLISKIGPTEQVRRGQVVKTMFDPTWDQFILAIHPANGGQPVPAPAWTEYYKECPTRAKKALLRLGAQVVISSMFLILGA